jgi:glycosyltransferase involved in cell wall biosynthesis
MNVLLVSSIYRPKDSSQSVNDLILSLRNNGHRVTLMTKYANDDFDDSVISVLNTKETPSLQIKNTKIRNTLLNVFEKSKLIQTIYYFLFPYNKPKYSKYNFFHKDETIPHVPTHLILEKIKEPYDLVIIFFWMNLLTPDAIYELYNKTKAPVFLFLVDMSPMTGGSHYFWDCRKFETNCSECPALLPKDSHYAEQNLINKINIFNKTQLVFLGNSWMVDFAQHSAVLKNSILKDIAICLNEKTFDPPKERIEIKKKWGIDTNSYVLFMGAKGKYGGRKGYKELVAAITIFVKNITKEELNNTILVIAGYKGDAAFLAKEFPLKTKFMETLDFSDLIEMYGLSDVFLSPSIQDAGPSTVNQSLMCGTPVVAFEMGTAVDVIKNQNTGYCAKYLDIVDYANGITYLFRLSSDEQKKMRQRCREMSVERSSLKSFAEHIEKAYFEIVK